MPRDPALAINARHCESTVLVAHHRMGRCEYFIQRHWHHRGDCSQVTVSVLPPYSTHFVHQAVNRNTSP